MGAGVQRWWRDRARYEDECAEHAVTAQPQRFFGRDALAGTPIIEDAVRGFLKRVYGVERDVPVIDINSGKRIA